jgi:hypothetical protein
MSSNLVFCSPIPSVEELERSAIMYRLKNIKQGHVKMHVINERPYPRNTELLYEITFDKKRVRQIVRKRVPGHAEWENPEKIIVTQDRCITDFEDGAVPTAVQIVPAKEYKTPREHFRMLSVQALGMDINGADGLHEADVESLMNRSDRTIPVVHADVRKGVETWRIDYVRKNKQEETGLYVSLWIAPSQGYSVIGIEVKSDQDGKRYTFVIDSEMMQYPVCDVWYPSKVVKTVKADNKVVDRQIMTIEEARFGDQIDETAFAPAGLELKPGKEVVDYSSGQANLKVWNGKELVKPSQVNVPPRNPALHRRPRWLQLTLAGSLGMIALIYFWRAFRRRRSASNPGA